MLDTIQYDVPRLVAISTRSNIQHLSRVNRGATYFLLCIYWANAERWFSYERRWAKTVHIVSSPLTRPATFKHSNWYHSLQVTHNASPVTPITYWWNWLKESADLVILGVTFDSKLTFEKHLRLVSRAASQRLGILRKSWREFHDRPLLERCFRGFVLPVLEYCSAVWCSAADTHLKLLDRVVCGARFLTGGVFECDIADRRSVAVLCMLYKIRCNPMHSLNDALPGPYEPVRVTRGAMVAHRYT